MKNKNVVISVMLITLTVLLLSQALLLEAKPKPRLGNGGFDDADFFTPDYNNGGTETFDAGGQRDFNYKCHCANQPGQKPCSGNIRLQVDTGSGFVNEKSDTCNIDEGQWCSANHTKTFNTADIYTFRIFCDEDAGTDHTQPSNEHVVLTVQESGCTENETQDCPLQQGVCAGTTQTCINGSWTECDYGSNYETEEATCDELDNDCNGFVDDIDADGDGSSPCGGMGIVNELLITGVNNNPGQIDVFEYRPVNSSYVSVWSTDTSGITGGNSGGEIGDLTHDGVNDFVINRYDGTDYILEVWTYNPSSMEWYRVWYDNKFAFIGDIGDFDNDGFEELVFENPNNDTVEVWGNDSYNATSFSKEATVKDCGHTLFHNAAGDLNNNGIPELVFQCSSSDDIEVLEWNGSGYESIASVTPPLSRGGGGNMFIDDMECNGDVNKNGVADCVVCGNSGSSHVLTYMNGTYFIEYNASTTSGDTSFTQTCSIGDIDNDGFADWFDSSSGGGLRVFSYQDGYYQQIWDYSDHGDNPPIGGSFVGDADNDGKGEFVVGYANAYKVELWESDEVEATNFSNTFTWDPAVYAANMIIGNLNPYNDDTGVDCNDSASSVYPGALDVCGDGIDQDCSGSDTTCNCADSDNDTYNGYDAVYCPTGTDCNDNNASINPGANETCGNGVDDDCDDEIDEGCGPVCGDDYCDGSAYNEDCRTCPEDCWAGERGACCGDDKCDTNKGETAELCPVDCS
ncbi:putative metal-binding motif-containing protein [Candidatus Woesearchaeota archaeon]|nr:putative metal-binding motif-containing protein [Candidatus Woesearchaeota archaeon]